MASDMFLKIDGIKGESSDADHKEWMEIESFSWGVSQPASAVVSTAGGGTVGRASFGDLSVTKILDSASPLIAQACVSGQHIKEIIIELFRSAGDKRVKYWEYKLEDSIISSVSIGGGGGLPSESITFNYAKITYTYTKQERAGGGGGGNVPGGWDLKTNKKV
jgi:type VI secretion system Hcp family effector